MLLGLIDVFVHLVPVKFAALGLDVGPDDSGIPGAIGADVECGPIIAGLVMEMVGVEAEVSAGDDVVGRVEGFGLGGCELGIVDPESSCAGGADHEEAVIGAEDGAAGDHLLPLGADFHRLGSVVGIGGTEPADGEHDPHGIFGAHPDFGAIAAGIEMKGLNELGETADDLDFLGEFSGVGFGGVGGIVNGDGSPSGIVTPVGGDLACDAGVRSSD